MYLSSVLVTGTLSYGVAMASAQAFPSTTTSTPTSTYSYQETSEVTISPSYWEYNFTYPWIFAGPTGFYLFMDASYKDTINVSWIEAAPYHLPGLSIQCWFRNRSSYWLARGADLTTDLTPNIFDLTEPNVTNVQVALWPYKTYNPCRFIMGDSQNHSLTENNGALSGFIAISDTNNSKGQLWSLDHPAPIINSTITAGSGGIRASVGEAIIWLSWTTVLSVVLLAY